MKTRKPANLTNDRSLKDQNQLNLPHPSVASDTNASKPFALAISPGGHILIDPAPPTDTLVSPTVAERLEVVFARSTGHGLLHLGSVEADTSLPPSAAFWREFASRFVGRLCQSEGLEEARGDIDLAFPLSIAEDLAEAIPPMTGAEYVRLGLFAEFWLEMLRAFRDEINAWQGTVQDYFQAKNPLWKLVGRVCFHLAENRRDPENPFAFLATYTTRLDGSARPRHLPMGDALKEYAGARNKSKLLSLLAPVQAAAAHSVFLRELIDTGEIFHPMAWKPPQALQFLRDVPEFETAGILCRIPDWWKQRNRSKISIEAKIGSKPSSGFGLTSLLDFSVDLSLDGEPVSPEEWAEIAARADGLALIRGKWIELDRERLDQVLSHWKNVQKAMGSDGLSFVEAMRLLAGAPIGRGRGEVAEASPEIAKWSQIVAGPWLRELLEGLRKPDTLASVDPGSDLKTTLRPYQQIGVRWLYFLYKIGLGPCLADDMGLGKTMQILALLLILKRERTEATLPHLLVVPASLMLNWDAEIQKFAPSLNILIAHPSQVPPAELAKLGKEQFAGFDLVISTYGTVLRLESLQKAPWDIVMLDEAQAVKNPDTKQTRAVKALKVRRRIVLTGTPVENRLSDLWSIFDFLNPGLLGSAQAFAAFSKRLAERTEAQYQPLRALVRPYILRRLKTDRAIINDLPDKIEVNAWCSLTKTQAVLYQESVKKLAGDLKEKTEGIERRGLILAYLTRFKQICNHPSQGVSGAAFPPAESGKFQRLREITESIAAKSEKALIFTQYKEMTEPLSEFLAGVFGRPGLVLHGGTPVKERRALVDRFQNDETVPFFVLSLKAGGVGLNLTAASHVIHFDRWWNPAVENQATDRAFRIGQKKNVLVHKFVCRGTIEEKIDELLTSKKSMSEEILAGGGEAVLTTEMSDRELMNIVALDLDRAMGDA
ncbi:MAG: DEAD/DEAH box helicase [Candidatus Riflebacteria bacterium]|nr:DEAD/DEAH box helicase [Candidatus Riflebacteria bacterium]